MLLALLGWLVRYGHGHAKLLTLELHRQVGNSTRWHKSHRSQAHLLPRVRILILLLLSLVLFALFLGRSRCLLLPASFPILFLFILVFSRARGIILCWSGLRSRISCTLGALISLAFKGFAESGETYLIDRLCLLFTHLVLK